MPFSVFLALRGPSNFYPEFWLSVHSVGLWKLLSYTVLAVQLGLALRQFFPGETLAWACRDFKVGPISFGTPTLTGTIQFGTKPLRRAWNFPEANFGPGNSLFLPLFSPGGHFLVPNGEGTGTRFVAMGTQRVGTLIGFTPQKISTKGLLPPDMERAHRGFGHSGRQSEKRTKFHQASFSTGQIRGPRKQLFLGLLHRKGKGIHWGLHKGGLLGKRGGNPPWEPSQQGEA